MPEPIFHAPGGDRGTALQQLRALREMARGGQGPGAVPAIASGVLAAHPDAAVAGLADDAAPATRFVDDAAAHAALLGHDPEALARAAQAAATRGVADPPFAGAAQHAADGAVPVTADAAAGARPTLLDQLRGAAGELRRPLAAEVAEDAQRVAGRGANVLDELRGGIGAMRGSGAAAREVVEEAVEQAPSLANRALEALRLAARVNPRG